MNATGLLNDGLASLGMSGFGDNLASGPALVAAGGALALGYALWEQMKFRWYRSDKNGNMLPGAWVADRQPAPGPPRSA